MKTKISRIGKSSLSVILSVMMIISTMLVGTMSASAAETFKLYYIPSDSDYNTIKNNSYTVKANICFSNGENLWGQQTMTDNGKTIGGKHVYEASYNWTGNFYGGFDRLQFQMYSGSTHKGQIEPISSWASPASNYYNKCYDGNNNKWIDYTPDSASVASSVSLTATPSPAEKDSPITLKATLSGKASGLSNVKYTFSKTSGGTGTFTNSAVTTTATTATATFTPSGTGSYTFKVVAEATGYTSVEKTVTVTVTAPEEYYLTGYMGGDFGTEKGYKFTETATKGIYSCKITPTNDLYALVTNTSQYYGPGKSNVVLTEKQWSEQGTTVSQGEYNKWGITGQSGKEIIIYWDSANKKIKWESAVEKYTLTLNVGNNGKGKIDSETQIAGSSSTSKSLEKGSSYKITVTPNTGYEVDTFTVGGVDKKSSLTNGVYSGTNITADTTVAVTFKQSNYTVTKGTESNGTFTVDKTSAHYNDTITVSGITPANGYLVSEVKYTYGTSTGTASLSSDKKSATFKMPASNVTVNVTFVLDNYAITKTVDPSTSGTITVKKNTTEVSTYKMGDTLTLTATPQSGYKFKSFTVTGGITATITTDTPLVNIASNGVVTYNLSTAGKYGAITITANFEKIVYTGITGVAKYSTTGADGSYTNTLSGATVTVASSGTIDGITVTAPEVAGYKFAGFSATNGTLANVNTTNRTAKYVPTSNNGVVTAQYKKIYSVTTTAGEHGSISASTTSAAGEQYKVTVTPASGYQIKSITVNGTPIALTSAQKRKAYTYTGTATSDETVAAEFEETSEVYYYVAVDTSWNSNPQLGTGITKVAEVSSSTNLYNGTTALRSGKTYKVWLVRSEDGKSVKIGDPGTGNNNYGMTVVPQSGYCYSYGSISSSNNFADTIPAATLSVSATSTNVNNLKNHPVNLSYTTSTNNKTAGQDSVKVTYTVKAPDGSNVTVTNNQFTPTTGGTYSVTATAVDSKSGMISFKTSSVLIVQINDSVPKYTVTYSSNNINYGSVSTDKANFHSGDSVEGNTTVKFTATAEQNYVFKQWKITTNGTTTTSTANPLSRAITSDTTIVAEFEEDMGTVQNNMYLIYNAEKNNDPAALTKNVKFYKMNSDGANIYTAKIPTSDITKKAAQYFALSSTTSYKSMYWQNDSSVKVTTTDSKNVDVGQQHYGKDNTQYYFGTFTAGENVIGITIKVNTSTREYTVIPTVERVTEDQVIIKAKDGTIRASYQKYADMADTKLTSGVTGRDSTPTYYETAKAKKGGTITIQTTILSAYRSKYYVKAFCINGESYGIITKSDAEAHKSDGVYTCTYAIPDMDEFEGDTLEITPIYYYFDDEDTVTFYVEGRTEELADVAGDTLAVYAFYQGGADEKVEFNAENMQAFGGFPGQPLVKDGGRFYMQVPKHLNGDASHPILGVTLSNYVWDDIHAGRVSGGNTKNMQTYDYNCFLRINDVKKAKDIFFEFKYRDGGNNIPTATFLGEESTSYKNGWEDLTNHMGDLVNIYNDDIGESAKDKEPLHVLVNGYINIGGSQHYATEWVVYAPDGKKIGEITPTALLAESAEGITIGDNKAKYQETYKALDEYKDHPVRISYEKAMWNKEATDVSDVGGDQALRIDGRWTYVTTNQLAEGNVEIQYANTLNDDFVTDPFIEGDNQGSITKTRAYFTNEDFYKKTTSGSIRVNPDEYFTFAAETDPENQYMFVGWWKRSVDGSYAPMTEAHSHMVGKDTFVARFIKTPEGNLGVRHQLYTGEPVKPGVDGVLGGQGNCYVKVEILDGDTVIATYGNTTSATSVSIDKKYIRGDSPYTMRITLTTVMKGNNLFKGTYRLTDTDTKYELVSNTSDNNSTGVVTTVRDYPISNLFKNADGTLAGKQLINSINYYSNIQPVDREYKITFNYVDRFAKSQKYIVKGILPDDVEEFDIQFVMSKAPYENIFMQTFTWDDANIVISEVDGISTAIVTAQQDNKKVFVKYNTEFTDGAYDKTLTLDYGSLVTVDGKRLEAPETNPQNANEKFSYWEIRNDDGDFVTNVYSRWFNYVLYDNYYIKPIYKETPDSITTSGISATIQFLEYSRNQWTDDNGNMAADGSSDRIFADFALAFTKNGELINPAQNECGIVLAVGPNIDGNTPDNVKFTTDEAKLKDFIKNGTAYTSDGANGTVKAVKSSKINKLDNKNRVELYNRFKNSSANTDPVIKAYSYIIDDNGEVVLSAPVYIRLYEESIKTYTQNAA